MCNNMCMHFSFMCNLHVNVRNYSGCTRLYRLYRLVVSNMNETTCEKQHFFAFANNKQHMRRLWVDGFEPVPTRADHENIWPTGRATREQLWSEEAQSMHIHVTISKFLLKVLIQFIWFRPFFMFHFVPALSSLFYLIYILNFVNSAQMKNKKSDKIDLFYEFSSTLSYFILLFVSLITSRNAFLFILYQCF